SQNYGEPHHARLSHVKPGRRYVEPEECKYSPTDNSTKCGEVDLIMKKCDDRIGSKYRSHDASRESIHTIDHRCRKCSKHDKDKKWNEPNTQIKISIKRYMNNC